MLSLILAVVIAATPPAPAPTITTPTAYRFRAVTSTATTFDGVVSGGNAADFFGNESATVYERSVDGTVYSALEGSMWKLGENPAAHAISGALTIYTLSQPPYVNDPKQLPDDTVDGALCAVIEGTNDSGEVADVWIDRATGYVRRLRTFNADGAQLVGARFFAFDKPVAIVAPVLGSRADAKNDVALAPPLVPPTAGTPVATIALSPARSFDYRVFGGEGLLMSGAADGSDVSMVGYLMGTPFVAERHIGAKWYVTMGNKSNPWVVGNQPSSEIGNFQQFLGVSPAAMAHYSIAQSSDEVVNGVACHVYRLAPLKPGDPSAKEPITLWVDAQGIIRRLVTSDPQSSPAVTLQTEFANVDGPVTIPMPAKLTQSDVP
jgi:outer membrane lipoprotein-sorting protein